MTDRSSEPGSVGTVQTRFADIELPEGGFQLDSGDRLPALRLAYETYGRLSEKRDNVIVICHALSGDAHVAGTLDTEDGPVGWWDEMVGPGKGIDTQYYFVVCANILGGCKGTTGPSSIDPRTGKPYGSSFPAVTVGDIVAAHRLLLEHLGVDRVAAVVGGSFGGMQVLEWAIRYPDSVDRCVCIASATSLSAQALAFDIVGRRAITSDPDWQGGDYYGTGREPDSGLARARQIGHITYLSPEMMTTKFGRERAKTDLRQPPSATTDAAAVRSALRSSQRFRSDFQVERYLEYQGAKFVKRFDANSYLHISRAMDEFDLAERFGSVSNAFSRISSRFLVVGLSADWLFPPEQSREIANALQSVGKSVSYCGLHAPHGHDAFLVDIEHLREVMRAFLPWVGRPRRVPGRLGPDSDSGQRRAEREQEFSILRDMIKPGSRVLDLGCGRGELLTRLAEQRAVSGLGIDIDIRHVIEVIDRGHDICQADIDEGLAMLPDRAYDYAVLGETLQVVRKPRFVLAEMLRVARRGIVTFPNFGCLSNRLHLGFAGRMPTSGLSPFEWYDTPNIHLFTLHDFIDLCRQDGIGIKDMVCIPEGRLSRWLVRAGLCALGASRVIVEVTRTDRSPSGPTTCRAHVSCAGRREFRH